MPACKFLECPGVLQTVVSTVALNVFFMILPLTYSLCSSRTCICFCEKDKDSLPVLSLHIKAKIIYQLQGDKGWWEQWWVSWTLPVVSAVSKCVYCQCFVLSLFLATLVFLFDSLQSCSEGWKWYQKSFRRIDWWDVMISYSFTVFSLIAPPTISVGFF